MAKNTLREIDNNLAAVDYVPLLTAIREILKESDNLFHAESERLHIYIDTIALAAAEKLRATKFKDSQTFLYTKGTVFATVNFIDGDAFRRFRTQIEAIKEQLQSSLIQAV